MIPLDRILQIKSHLFIQKMKGQSKNYKKKTNGKYSTSLYSCLFYERTTDSLSILYKINYLLIS